MLIICCAPSTGFTSGAFCPACFSIRASCMLMPPSLTTRQAGESTRRVVTLTTTGGVSLSVDPVTTTTVPSADTTSTTWTPTYSSAGTHSIVETGSATAISTPGADLVSVHLAGTKGGSNRFANGNYQATVTLRCE